VPLQVAPPALARSKPWVAALALVPLLLVMILAGCGRPPEFAASLSSAPTFVLFEGLPHPATEADAYARELSRTKTFELHGSAFYAEQLELDDASRAELRTALSDEALFGPFRADKKCGPFHADFGLQWDRAGTRYTLLLCFSCGEAAWYDDAGNVTHNDLSDARKAKLVQLLFRHGKNRPSMETVERRAE
jgi:hypothetical protein